MENRKPAPNIKLTHVPDLYSWDSDAGWKVSLSFIALLKGTCVSLGPLAESSGTQHIEKTISKYLQVLINLTDETKIVFRHFCFWRNF
ncbi:MAG: hypothetical protein SFY32_10110 [Bacteroidota bacterium]|nr:hypothetical protein [Bacteroidota bacterium]